MKEDFYMKHTNALINTFRRVTLGGKAMTLCINFTVHKYTKKPPRSSGRTFDPVLGVFRNNGPDIPAIREYALLKDESISGGIALINVPMETAREYINKLVRFLQYAYVSGGATLNLKDKKIFSMKSKDKNMKIEFKFGESNAETAEDTEEYVIPVKGKIILSAYHIKTLISYFTNTEHVEEPF